MQQSCDINNVMSKLLVQLCLLFPLIASAQLRFDSLSQQYHYRCNCNEYVIVQGRPTLLSRTLKKQPYNLFKLRVDTVYYAVDIKAKEDSVMYLLSTSPQSTLQITTSNLFILKKCFYCESPASCPCRPLLYYEVYEAANNHNDTIQLHQRDTTLPPCKYCETMRSPASSRNKVDINKLNQIEKFIQAQTKAKK
jgi:hypothetical protein